MELTVYCEKAIDKLISIDMKGSDKCYKGDEPRRSGERQTVTEKEAERLAEGPHAAWRPGSGQNVAWTGIHDFPSAVEQHAWLERPDL